MATAAVQLNQEVDVHSDNEGRIIIEPVRVPVYQLDDLLDQMNAKTFPDDDDFGPAVGKEVW